MMHLKNTTNHKEINMALNREAVAAIYVATFDRAADSAGLNWWVNESGLGSLEEVAESFFDQPEALNLQGLTHRESVELLYNNLFNKAPADDVAGINYWVTQLDSGAVAIEDIIVAL
jgi:hypothetical protein